MLNKLKKLPIISKHGAAYLNTEAGVILKISAANSLLRTVRDYIDWLCLSHKFRHPVLVQPSNFDTSSLEGDAKTVVLQKFISAGEGSVLGDFSETDLLYFLREFKEQRNLIVKIIEQVYFLRIEQRKLFADLVGKVAPIFESQNFMLLDYNHPKKSPALRIVDTGFSPHEKTLTRFGGMERFLQNPEFKKEEKLMRDSLAWLQAI